MKTDHLHDTLQQLHEELARADRIDSESEQLLRKLLGDISALLASHESSARGAEDGEAHAGLVERLAETSKRFEHDHPGLVNAIGRLADALSRSGV